MRFLLKVIGFITEDLNEDTHKQIELINQSLAELHTDNKLISKPRKRIGYISEE